MNRTDWVEESELIATIEATVIREGEKAEVARQYGVSPQYLADVLNERRKIGPKLALALGYTLKIVYVPVQRGENWKSSGGQPYVASGLGKGVFPQECEAHLSTTNINVSCACKGTRDDNIPESAFNCSTCFWGVLSGRPQDDPCRSCDPMETRRNWKPMPDRKWESKA